MYRRTEQRGFITFALVVCLPSVVLTQAATEHRQTKTSDPFVQKVEELSLEDETVFEGIAKLSQTTTISISLEAVFPEASDPATVQAPKFRTKVSDKTISEVLDWLCALDQRYVWERDRNTANFFPRNTLNKSSYIMNQEVALLSFEGVRDARIAYTEARRQFKLDDEGVGLLRLGGSLGFGKPWTARFSRITFRKALNRIAEQLGPTYGWQFGGGKEYSFCDLPLPAWSNR